MEKIILTRLTTLGHPQRMAVFRLLMRRYPDAVPAGELAQALSLKPSTLSVYLSALVGAGLISKTRQKTSLLYQVQMQAAGEIVDYIFVDCCRGRPQLCPQLDTALPTKSQTRPAQKQNVIFICTGNSARSIMAESILRHTAGDRFNVYSAGTRPADAPKPQILSLLRSKGHDTTGLRSKTLNEFHQDGAVQMDFVFTVCDQAANEECPIWPGRPISGHWGIPEPSAATGTDAEKHLAFVQAFAQIQARILAFIALPQDSLDKIKLQNHIDDIGKMSTKIED